MSLLELNRISEIEWFEIFNIDCGAAIRGAVKAEGRLPTQEEEKSIRKLSGVDLWHFRPRQRTGKVVDFDTLSREELERERDKERRERVAQLEKIIQSDAYLDQLEADDIPICELLPPPKWV